METYVLNPGCNFMQENENIDDKSSLSKFLANIAYWFPKTQVYFFLCELY